MSLRATYTRRKGKKVARCSIIIPTYSNSKGIAECLASIQQWTQLDDIEIIVVANGAPEETREICSHFPVNLLWFDKPLGYTVSTNIGIRAATGEFLILLNDDCVILSQVTSAWVDTLLQPFLDDPKMGITGPVMNWCNAAERHFLIFFCVMIRKAMLDEIGILDEIFSPGSGEDTDLSCRAVDSGWKIRQVPSEEPTKLVDKNSCPDLPEWKRQKMHSADGFRLYHDGNATFSLIPEIYEPAMQKNHAILKERYGNKVNTPTGGCSKCGGPMVDGTCVGAENKLNCDGLYLWRASVIDGWFAVCEGAWLASQVKALPKGANTLEIGSWHGRSSRFIADNLSEGAKVWCCDTFNGSSGEPEMHGTAHWDRGDHAAQYWWCNLQEHIDKGRVVPVRMHSENAALTFAHLIEKGQMEKFDLIFIDGDHSAEGIKTDVNAWFPLLKDGGLICGHDYYKESEGPHWVYVRQYVESRFPDVQKATTSIWWTRKASANLHQDQLNYQIESQCDDPEYAKVVESAQREIVGKLFADIDRSAVILDAGCGNLHTLSDDGFTNVVRVDLIDAPDVLRCDMHEVPCPDHTFDVVYCSHALEHAYDPIKVLTEFKRVLKPDGQLFLVLPYPDVIDSEHRAKAHCGSGTLGLTVRDNGSTLLRTIEGTGFQYTHYEQGDLRGEPEVYLVFRHEVRRGRVFDTFIFHNELDLLEIRLNELNDVVDRFVIVEGTLTHSGQPKALIFDENIDRFKDFLHKINHVVVDNYPEATDPWVRERWQRDAIMLGLQDCEDDDIIILGDADEIASAEAIKNYQVEQGLCRLKQRLFYYYLNCENKEGWDWLKIAPYKTVKELTPCGVRYPPAGNTPLIENGGWHFSFLGSAEQAIAKVQSYAHWEYNTPEMLDKDRVESLMSEGKDIFGRDCSYEFVEINDNYPQYVKEHVDELAAKGMIKRAVTVESVLEQAEKLESRLAALANNYAPVLMDVSPLRKKHWTVTAEISTKDRYFTTLPMAISAVATQTHKPDKLKIYDDGEQLDLRGLPPFDNLLKMLDELKIEWEVIATPRKGQVTNHQHCLDNADTDFIFRVDDDEIPMPDCLERLLNTICDYGNGEELETIGAVAGLVHHPGAVSPLPDFVDGSMNDVRAGVNMQWFDFNSHPREVEHLYSTFLYRVGAGRKAGGYPKGLSSVGHREETLFTHTIKRAGYKLLVTPYAKTFHLRESTGGIRSFNDSSLWEKDEKVFQSYLAEWGMNGGKPTKVIVADMGRGDHYLLLSILPQLKERHKDKELILAVCFPEIFDGQDIKLISIADAKVMLGDRFDDALLYKYAWHTDAKRPVHETMLEFWG